MDWIRQNKSLATIVGVFLVGSLAIGGVLLMANSSYSTSLDEMTSLSGKVTMQEKASLYPSEANLETLAEKVSGYEDAVSNLGGVLLKLQPPVKEITDTDFVAKLKTRIADVRKKAGDTSIKLPKDFAFGFDTYTKGLPPTPEAARQLNDYFETVDAVVNTALDAGIVSLDNLVRSELIVEKPNAPAPKAEAPEPKKKSKTPTKIKGKPVKPAKEIAKVVERRQLTLSMTTDQKAFQALTNALASPSKMPYFTVVRVLRVENEKQDGPFRNAVIPPPEPVPSADPAPVKPAADGAPAAPQAEVIAAPKPAAPDAIAVMGKELLKVYFEIDLVRFLAPAPETASN
jgi:hypothetical protein